jgi:predicted DNA-binding antitoxin AbrB/MazE fold protein
MEKSIEAVFDGKVLCPEEPLSLEPNTRVRILIQKILPSTEKPSSFLRTARSLQLDGPEDWSENVDKYLSGEELDYAQ